MPRIKEYNTPADMLKRLPGKPIITVGDKLATLQTMFHRCEIGWRDLHLSIINAIREDIRLSAWRKREQTQRNSAPADTRAPSRTEERTEQAPSIPPKALERKIDQDLYLRIEGHNGLNLYAAEDDELLYCLSPDLADQLAHALTELAGDLRQDIAARAWSQDMLKTTTG